LTVSHLSNNEVISPSYGAFVSLVKK